MFGADPEHGEGSRDALRTALAEGSLLACEVVWAELAAGFPSADEAASELRRLGIAFAPIDELAALAAGGTFAEYRRRGGGRERVVADFLIGAHAEVHSERLLTRDRGFYRSYFADLELLDPAA